MPAAIRSGSSHTRIRPLYTHSEPALKLASHSAFDFPRVMCRVLSAISLAAIAMAGLTTSVAHAQADAVPAVPPIEFEKYTLPNGLQVILHQDRSVPLVAVNVWYHVGSGDEQPGRTGFAHLFEHIMFMGSLNVPVGMFDIWLEGAGANNNGSTTPDRTNYYEWMPSNALPLALWLEADRLGNLLPTMTQEKLDLQRDVVKNERRQGVDNVPYGMAYETILAALFPAGHPYSWSTIGSMEDLSAASLEDVNSFFSTYYAPNNASLSIAGDFDPDSVKQMISEYFGWIPRGSDMPPRPQVRPAPVARDTFLVLEDRVQLPRLYNTWHSASALTDDDAALSVLAYILAGDKNSRLYESMVYRLQVAQDVRVAQDGMRLDGMFMLQVTPRPEHTPSEMQRMVNEELMRIQREGVTERELQRAKSVILASSLNRLAGVRGKADELNYYNYFADDPGYASQAAAKYARLTTGDIRRVAREYLGKPRVTLTVVPTGESELMVSGGAR